MYNDDVTVSFLLRDLFPSAPCPNPQGFTNGADGIAFKAIYLKHMRGTEYIYD